MICIKGGTVEKTRRAQMTHGLATRPRLLMDAENGSIEADGPVNDEDGTLFAFFLPLAPALIPETPLLLTAEARMPPR